MSNPLKRDIFILATQMYHHMHILSIKSHTEETNTLFFVFLKGVTYVRARYGIEEKEALRLSHEFRHYMGCSIQDYFITLRINYAKEFLVTIRSL